MFTFPLYLGYFLRYMYQTAISNEHSKKHFLFQDAAKTSQADLKFWSPLIHLKQERLVLKIRKQAYFKAISCFKQIILIFKKRSFLIQVNLLA